MIDLVIWMNIPSHHQRPFINELMKYTNVKVFYYDKKLMQLREKEGWLSESLGNNEFMISNSFEHLYQLFKYRRYYHITPTIYSNNKLLINLICYLILKIKWSHWSEHSNPFSSNSFKVKIRKIYSFLLNKYAFKVYGISKLALEEFKYWKVLDEKIELLPYSIEDLSVKCKKKEKTSVIKFLYVGRLSKLKGVDLIIKANKILNVQGYDFKIIFIGKNIDDFKLNEPNLEYEGVVPSTVIFNYYCNADVLIMPSLYDGWGAVISEATSLGLPVIGSNKAGASHHLIQNNFNGFIINPNIDELVEKMRFFLDNPSIIKLWRENSKISFNEFSVSNNVKKFITSIDKNKC